ncbi:hypothetical protein FS837_008066 [Tulasnella sp. UAMH 9824]|nr:hypothetical protein FS837_008066 [Tulasnella sp. UAMH 9824]
MTAHVEETPVQSPTPIEIAEHPAWVKPEQHQDILSDAPIPGAEPVITEDSTKPKGVGSGKELSKKPKLIEGDIEL